MDRSSSRKIIQRFSGHKPDDGHLAADIKTKDLKPLLRIVDAALEATMPCQAAKVLYLKQDIHDKFFLTTDFDAPGQHPACRAPTLRSSQHLDATSRETRRAVYWMTKLPHKPEVQATGEALIHLCASPSTTEFGLACTSDLRDRIQGLHNAIHAPDDALRGREDPNGGHAGVFGSLQRTLTNRHSRSSSRSNSPEKRPRQALPSPRTVSFSPTEDTHFVKVSPRKVPSTADTPRTPRLGQERDAELACAPLPSSQPPQRALPALPSPSLEEHRSDTAAPPPNSPSQAERLKRLEMHRPHPQRSLRTPPITPPQRSQANTPAHTPRDPD